MISSPLIIGHKAVTKEISISTLPTLNDKYMREYELLTSRKLCWRRLIKFRKLNRHWDKLPARKRYHFNALIRRATSKLVTNSFPFFLPRFNKPSDFAACGINPGRDRPSTRSWSILPHPFRLFTLAIGNSCS